MEPVIDGGTVRSDRPAGEPEVLRFRTAVASDVEQIVALVESAYRGETSKIGWTTESHLLEGQRTDHAAVAADIGRDGSRFLLAENAHGLVACAHLERRQDAVYFGMFAVRPGFQGNGTGGMVLAEAERLAREDFGAELMEMQVIAQRRDLIAWYERKGYRLTGETRPFPYGDERFGLPQRADLYFVVLTKPV